MSDRGSEQAVGHPRPDTASAPGPEPLPAAPSGNASSQGDTRPSRPRSPQRRTGRAKRGEAAVEPRARRLSRGLGPVLLVLVALAGLGALALQRGWVGGDEQGPGTSQPLPDSAEEPEPRLDRAPVQGEWRSLPVAPLEPRNEQAAIWADDRLLVWGGVFDDGYGRRVFYADGAALDGSGTWSPLSGAPLAPRTGHAAVWAGSELVIWGGEGSPGYFADGAAYSPAADTWRVLPDAPLSPRSDAAAVWTGESLLLFGGNDNGGPLGDGAAYEPVTGSWRPLPALPETLEQATDLRGVWAGDAAVLWDPGQGGLAFPEIARFDAADESWTPLPSPTDGESGIPLVTSTDTELLALLAAYDGTRTRLAALPGGAQDWQERGVPPAFEDPWMAAALWTGQDLILVLAEDAAEAVRYDPDADLWALLPDAPLDEGRNRTAVWTGEELLMLAGPAAGEPAIPTAAAAWRFAR